jgi:DNA-binding NarL/FixJ family response regulator
LQSRLANAQIGETGLGNDALRLVGEFQPDVILMDLHLPDADGIELSAKILAQFPSVKIIVMSGDPDLSRVNQALKHGVSGYVLKSSAPEELVRAVTAVMAGQPYLFPEANAAVVESYRKVLSEDPPAARATLSTREKEVVRLVADGLRSKEIAERLGVAVKTVETYRRRLMLKLKCKTTAELVRKAIHTGVVEM